MWTQLRAVVGTALFIIGLASIPEDAAKWRKLVNLLPGPTDVYGPGLILVGLLLLVTAFWTPFRRRQQPTEVPAAEGKSVEHKRLEVQFLTNLSESAVHMMLNRPLHGDLDVQRARLNENLDWWDREVQAALVRVGATDHEKNRFRTLVTVPQVFEHGTLDAPREANIIAEKVSRLDETIKRLSSS